MLFVIIGHDAPDGPAKRPAVRPAHLAHLEPLAQAGRVKLAGPFLDKSGSLIVVEAESLAEVSVSKDEVAFRLHRSRGWVYKWWNRYNKNKDFTDLSTHSRAPRHIPGKISEEIRREIKIARSELQPEKAEGKAKVQIGVDAVRERLKIKRLRKIPSAKSIERILKGWGMIQRHGIEKKPIKAKLQEAEAQKTPESIVSSHVRTTANPQQMSGKNVYTSQTNSQKQNPSWVLKLLQGRVNLVELNNGLSGKVDQKEIQKLHKCVLNNPRRQRNRAAIIVSYLYGVPKSKISSSLLVSPEGVYQMHKTIRGERY